MDLNGTGLGSTTTLLTIQNNGAESGCVGYGSVGGAVTTGAAFAGGYCTGSGDAKTGNSQTGIPLYTLGSIGVTNTSQLNQIGLVFNGNQTNNSLNMTINALGLGFFTPAGVSLFTANIAGPINLTVQQGTGNSGFLFVLDSNQQGQLANAITAAGVSTGSVQVGAQLGFERGGTDGPENLFFTSTNAATVPEPSAVVLLGTILLGVGWGIRRRRK
jgi:hypothetical protein